jgi:tRNA pseudouridine32 synthase / 23S rRNA pseudouridine746 synthase
MNAKLNPEEMVARLLYRDGLMLVIDKPAGIAVHRGPKGGESLEDHFGALRFGLPRAPALAHRLDRETSGCLVLGRHRKALATLGKLFKTGAIGKCYWAVVEGGPTEDEGTIDLPLGRRDESRGWWMKPDPDGQPAVTKWRVMGRSTPSGQAFGNARAAGASPPPVSAASGGEGLGVGGDARTEEPPPQPSSQLRFAPQPNSGMPEFGASERPKSGIPDFGWEGARPSQGERVNSQQAYAHQQLTWLALEPVNGRTHQLRVHCAAQGWPIVGDTIYGTQASLRSLRKEGSPRIGGPPLQLHSREIIVPLYKNRDPIKVMAPVPLAMQEKLYACGWQGEVFRLVD